MAAAPSPGFCLWFTGLPSSGKSTLAAALAQALAEQGTHCQILDSDALRKRLLPEAGYSDEERARFYDLIVFLAELLTRNGVNVLIAATAPRQAQRDAARTALTRFAEVYVRCAPSVCRARDPKGLWAQAAAGEIAHLPGAGAPYEAPVAPDLTLDTAVETLEESLVRLLKAVDAWGFVWARCGF